MKKIYVASSWRNSKQTAIVETIQGMGFNVYDFKNPKTAFRWSDIDPDWETWTPTQMRKALDHPLAVKAYVGDFQALDNCDALVLVLPCGRSAHAEAGYVAGQGKPVFVLFSDGDPELMYKIFCKPLCVNVDDLNRHLNTLKTFNYKNAIPDESAKTIKERLFSFHLSKKNDTEDTVTGAVIGWNARDIYHREAMELLDEAFNVLSGSQIGLDWQKRFKDLTSN